MRLPLLLILISTPLVYAQDLQAEFEFTKKPPEVALIYLPENKELKSGPTIDQKNREFTKGLFVGAPGSEMTITNSDDTDHNIYADDQDAGATFDIGLAPPGSETKLSIDWKDDMVVKIGCKIHPKMRAYVANISSKHHQIIEFDREQQTISANLDTFPANLKLVHVWLPKYDPIEVSLAKGESKTVTLMKSGKERGTVTLKRN